MSALLFILAAAVRVVPHEPAENKRAAALAGEAPAVVARVARRLDLIPPEEILIVLTPDPPRTSQAAAALGLSRPPPWWTGGLAEPGRGRMILFTRRATSYPHDSLEGLLAHETAHLVFDAHLPPKVGVPLWFQEGLAMAVERDLSLADALRLAQMTMWGQPVPLDQLDHGWPAGEPQARSAYAQSLSVFSFAEARAWPGAVRRLTEALNRGLPFERAFLTAFGMSTASLEYEWRKSVRWNYLFLPLMGVGIALQALIGVLAVMAIIASRRKRRERLQAMEVLETSEGADGIRSEPGEDGT